MLPKSFKAAKCKTSLRLAVARIKLLRNKRAEQVRQMRKDLAQLLEKGQDQTARLRVEHVIQEEKTVAAYELIELYCEQIVARMQIVESQKKCPVDLKEAIAGVLFASSRCADIPELADVSKNFSAKYGKDFAAAVLELRPDSGVDRLIVEKLSARPSDINTKNKFLSEVAKENNIKWEAVALEETVRVHQPDVLPGPSSFPSASSQRSSGIPSPQSQSPHQESSPVPGRTGLDRKFDKEPSLGRQKWDMNFPDATSAAQAAAESAEMASYAARAAVELAARGDPSFSPTRQRHPTAARSQSKPRQDPGDERTIKRDQDEVSKKSPRPSDDEDQRFRSPQKFDSPKSSTRAAADEAGSRDDSRVSAEPTTVGGVVYEQARRQSVPSKKSPRPSDDKDQRSRSPKFADAAGSSDDSRVSAERTTVGGVVYEQAIRVRQSGLSKKSPRPSDDEDQWSRFPKFDSPKSSTRAAADEAGSRNVSGGVIDEQARRQSGLSRKSSRSSDDEDQRSRSPKFAAGTGSRSHSRVSADDLPKFDFPEKDSEDDSETGPSERKNGEAVYDDAPEVQDTVDVEQRLFMESFVLDRAPPAKPEEKKDVVDRGQRVGSSPKTEGGGLDLGRLKGGMRNRGQLGPSFAVRPSPPSDPPARESRPQNKSPITTVEPDTVTLLRGPTVGTGAEKTKVARSPKNPEPKIVSDAKPDEEEQFPKTAGVWTRGGAVSMRTSLSRNKPRAPEPEAPPPGPPETEATARGLGPSSVRSPIKKKDPVETKGPPPKTETASSGISPGPVESPVKPRSPLPKTETLESPTKKKGSEEGERSKPAEHAHVHPMLPDFETIQAHFRALRSNRR